MANGGGKSAEGGGRRFVQERAHGAGLIKKSLHLDEVIDGDAEYLFGEEWSEVVEKKELW